MGAFSSLSLSIRNYRLGSFHADEVLDRAGYARGIAHGGWRKMRHASNPLAFFTYRWVRYQERRLMSMGVRTIRHVQRRLRIAIAAQGIRRPPARPSHQAC